MSNVIDLLYCYSSNSESDESGNESDSISTAELGDQSEQNIEVVTEHSSSGDTRQRAISLLDRLRAPRKSELDRKRRTVSNLPPRGKRKCKSTNSSASSSATVTIRPQQRVSEFKDESLVVSNGKLFCNACREELNLKKSSVKNHISSVKHKNGKVQLQAKAKRERDIADALQKHNGEQHLRGETLPIDQQVYRVKVVSCFLRAAVPLNKMQHFRNLLEENAYRLTDRHYMSDLIPFILQQEQHCIQNEISGKDVSVIFDGTTRLGEALAIVLRYISPEWTIEQRLVRMQLLSQSLKGEEVAREIIHVLATDYSIGSKHLLAAMRDRASVNNAAMRTVAVLYPEMIDIGCFSHTIDHVGEHFKTPHLHEFGLYWVSLFSHSPKTRLLWREQTSRAMPSYSPTRWWNRWELFNQIMVQFGDVEPFLRRNEDIAPATKAKLLSFFTDNERKSKLKMELAVVIDYGENFVKATYDLEGDGPLIFHCFEIIDTLCIAIKRLDGRSPNAEAVANDLSKGSLTYKKSLIEYARTCVQPGIIYFYRQLESSLKVSLQAFKAGRMFSPMKVYSMKPDNAMVDSLSVFPFITRAMIIELKAELPTYIAKTADVSSYMDPLEWWKLNCSELPSWSTAAKMALLVQPSSGSAERVFSLLKYSFGDQQDHSLKDYIETSLMLQYNKR